MFGNWAIGRAAIVTAPTTTIRIEMTMATMGRLMKNFDMSFSPCLIRCDAVRLRIHCRARSGLLYALDDHALAGLQAFPHHPHRADLVTDRDRLNADLIRAVQNGHLIAALEFSDRPLSHPQSSLDSSSHPPNPPLLPSPPTTPPLRN